MVKTCGTCDNCQFDDTQHRWACQIAKKDGVHYGCRYGGYTAWTPRKQWDVPTIQYAIEQYTYDQLKPRLLNVLESQIVEERRLHGAAKIVDDILSQIASNLAQMVEDIMDKGFSA